MNGKCEGRKSLAELYPSVVLEAKRLARANPKNGERRFLRKIAAELAKITDELAVAGGKEQAIKPAMDGHTAPRAFARC